METIFSQNVLAAVFCLKNCSKNIALPAAAPSSPPAGIYAYGTMLSD